MCDTKILSYIVKLRHTAAEQPVWKCFQNLVKLLQDRIQKVILMKEVIVVIQSNKIPEWKNDIFLKEWLIKWRIVFKPSRTMSDG